MTQESGEEKRDILLMALSELGGSAHTGQIREISGIKSNVMGHHMKVLQGEKSPRDGEVALVERDGQEQLDNTPMPANIYQLTETGHDRVEKLEKEQDGFVGLTDQAIRMELTRLRADHEELRDEHEQLKQNFNNLLDRLPELDLTQ